MPTLLGCFRNICRGLKLNLRCYFTIISFFLDVANPNNTTPTLATFIPNITPKPLRYVIPATLPQKQLLKKLLDFEFPTNRINRILHITYKEPGKKMLRPESPGLKQLISLILENITETEALRRQPLKKNIIETHTQFLSRQEKSLNSQLEGIFAFLTENLSSLPTATTVIIVFQAKLFALFKEFRSVAHKQALPTAKIDKRIDDWENKFKSALRSTLIIKPNNDALEAHEAQTTISFWFQISQSFKGFIAKTSKHMHDALAAFTSLLFNYWAKLFRIAQSSVT